MIFSTLRKKHQSDKAFSALPAVLLLLLYLAGATGIDSFHRLFHESEVELHNTAHEKDACHKKIYHNEKEKGCEHRTHLAESKKCLLCDLSFHADHIATITDEISTPVFSNEQQSSTPTIAVTCSILHLPARAPPVL